MTDWTLLRAYLDHGSEAAFTQLVDRHMKLVYGTCRREVTDPQLAEDVTQNVFVLFARKAPTFTPSVSVAAWLFHAARLASRDALKGEARRRRREEEALKMEQERTDRDADWQQIEPLLNDALAALPEGDREVILLRYFDDLTPHELAAQLNATEAAVRKRLSRAVERLRRLLTKKEVSLTALALTALLTEQSARAAPLNASVVAQNALRQAALGGAAAVALSTPGSLSLKGIYLLMEAGQKKALALTAALILLGIGVTIPVALWKARAAGGGFTDNAPRTAASAGSAEAEAVRAEINNRYRDRVAKVNGGDSGGFLAHVSPDFAVFYPNGASQSLASLTQNPPPEAKIVASVEVRSFQLTGNKAVVTYRLRSDATLMKGPNEPAERSAEDVMMEDAWEKRAGAWVNVSRRLLKDKPL